MSDSTCIACGDGADSAEELQELIEDKNNEAQDTTTIQGAETCPECGEAALRPEGGCTVCQNCFYSPCK